MTVHPNPTDNLLYIELSGTDIANVTLYDLQGRIVEGVSKVTFWHTLIFYVAMWCGF